MIKHKLEGFDLVIDGNTIRAKIGSNDIEIQIEGVKKVTARCNDTVVASSDDIEGLAFQMETLIRVFGVKKCG